MPIGSGAEPLVEGVQRHWPLRVHDRVTYPDYVDEAPRLLQREDDPFCTRPAYQDPPVVGRVLAIIGRDRRTARCEFPGIGVRDIGIEMLTRVEL